MEEFNTNSMLKVRTSGSTGTPKEYEVSRSRMLLSAQRTCDFFNLKKGDSAFLCISPEYIGGKMMLVRCLEREMNLIIGNLSAFPFETKIEADFAAFVPLQINRILKEDPDQLLKIKNIIIGGGPLNSKDEVLLTQMGVNAYATFGMTETLSHIALRKVGEEEYQVLEGIKIEVDEKDQLIIKDQKLTGLKSLKTNDIVELKEGNKFVWKGRSDHVINSGGVKIHPEIVEGKLGEIIEKPFFITKKKDEQLGEKLVLIIESDQEEKYDFKKVLDKYEVPKEVIFSSKFNYTDTEKINRLETLRKLGFEG